MPKLLILILILVIITLAGCQQPATGPDADRILHMANDETGLITAPRERLTRQLNIANRQTQNNRQPEARQTLAQARQTLEKADKPAFTDQQRLAGWISLAELARKADDKPFANSALDQAIAALNELNPQQLRCEFVLGVERELRQLRGDKPAAQFLITAGDWAIELTPPSVRRAAYLEFTKELFLCNDYDGAVALLHKDQDPTWRADSLMAISDQARLDQRSWLDALSPIRTYGLADSGQATTPAPFSKRLDFENNYQQR
jgi:hypothetical protein